MKSMLKFVLGSLLASAATAAPVFETGSIFPLQSKHVHGSSIVECSNGDLLACWFHGSGERTANDVQVQGARKRPGAERWGPVFVMADTPDLPDCNPVLFVDGRERLWLFWIAVVANGWQHSLLKYRWSDDYLGEGPPRWAWQDVIVPKPGDRFPGAIEQGFAALGAEEGCWGEYAPPYERMVVEAAHDKAKRQRGWMTRIHPTALPDGRVLLPLYSDGFNLGLVLFTDDGGKTWQASSPIVGYGPIQPSIVRKRNGDLMAYLRDGGGPPQRVQVSRSSDRGETWSPATDTTIPNPSSSLEVLLLSDGRWLMVANDTEEDRHRLTALLSDDEGVTWGRRRRIEPADDQGRSFGYPSAIQGRDGRIHLTYSRTTREGRTIQHTVLNLDWLAE